MYCVRVSENFQYYLTQRIGHFTWKVRPQWNQNSCGIAVLCQANGDNNENKKINLWAYVLWGIRSRDISLCAASNCACIRVANGTSLLLKLRSSKLGP